MPIESELSAVDVVLVGSFNPAIFTPAWFEHYDLLPGAAEGAEDILSAPGVSRFRLDWLHLTVTPDRFQAGTLQAPFVRASDLAVRVFQEHLFHTPIRALGINRAARFRLNTVEDLEKIWNILAPQSPWQSSISSASSDSQANSTALMVSRMADEGRPSTDSINATVERSNRAPYSIHISVNDHYTIDESSLDSARCASSLLAKKFDRSVERSNDLIHQVVSLASRTQESLE